jgi:hypothetical protein
VSRRLIGTTPAPSLDLSIQTIGAAKTRANGSSVHGYLSESSKLEDSSGKKNKRRTPKSRRKSRVPDTYQSSSYSAFFEFCECLKISKLRVFNSVVEFNSRRLHHIASHRIYTAVRAAASRPSVVVEA